MTRFALIAAAAVAATLTAPAAFAQDAAAFAVQHFNQDQDSIGDIRTPRVGSGDVTVSSRGGSYLADVYAHLNGDFDSLGNLRGTTGQVTVASGDPAFGADIFAELRAASLEDE